MQIGVVTTSYPRFQGDSAGCFVAELARWLCEQGERVEVLAPAPAARLAGDPPGLAVRALRHRPGSSRLVFGAGAPDNLAAAGLGGLAARVEAPALLARLAAELALRARRWDAVISHWLLPSSLAASLAARSLPQLAIAHSSDVHLLARLGRLGGALLELLASPGSQLVLTASHLRAPLEAIALGPQGRRLVARAQIQRMGIPAAALSEPSPDLLAALRSRHRLEGKPVILSLGRLVPVKGTADLLAACAGLRPPVVLAIAGAGPERGALEATSRGLGLDARFLGEVRGDEKRAWLAAATLLALPSRTLADGRSDSAPLVLLEAMAAGLPVVASATGGNAELIRDGESGLLVPERDPTALSAAIARLLGDGALRGRLAGAALALARAHTWDVTGPRLQALLRTCGRCRDR
jgi:glycosyltransferase involved in cell wall biosynthesis